MIKDDLNLKEEFNKAKEVSQIIREELKNGYSKDIENYYKCLIELYAKYKIKI